MIGRFPRFSPDGTRMTVERPGYWQAQFIDNDTEIAHDGERLLIGGKRTDHPAPNELSAGAGRWAGWRPDIGVYTSWGETHPAGGCPTVSPDGEFFYVDDRQGDTKALIHAGFRVASGAIVEVRASRTALVFTLNGRTWGVRRDIPDIAHDIQTAPAEFSPVPIDTPYGPWVLNKTHSGIILRPFGQKKGYRFDNGGQTFEPDGTWLNGRIHVVFADVFGNLSVLMFDPLSDLVDLTEPVAPTEPPPPIDPPPPDLEPPHMSIPDYSADVAALLRPRLRRIQGDEDGTRAVSFEALNYAVSVLHQRDPRVGLLEKRGGAQVRDRAADVLLYDLGNGTAQVIDVISDAEGHDGTPTPGWGPADIRPIDQWRPPYPVSAPPPVDPPVDPPPPAKPSEELKAVLAELVTIKGEMAQMRATTAANAAALTLRVEALENKPVPRYRVVGSTGRQYGHSHSIDVRLEPQP